MNQVSCDSCGSDDVTLLREAMGLLFYQCKSCGKSLSYKAQTSNSNQENSSSQIDILGTAANAASVVAFFESDLGENITNSAKESLEDLQEIGDDIVENVVEFVQDLFD